MSMSRVPWSTFARRRVRLAMVDIRPPIGDDGRHSTVDLSRPQFQDYMSNDDFSRSHLSSGPWQDSPPRADGRQPLPNRVTSELPVIQEEQPVRASCASFSPLAV